MGRIGVCSEIILERALLYTDEVAKSLESSKNSLKSFKILKDGVGDLNDCGVASAFARLQAQGHTFYLLKNVAPRSG